MSEENDARTWARSAHFLVNLHDVECISWTKAVENETNQKLHWVRFHMKTGRWQQCRMGTEQLSRIRDDFKEVCNTTLELEGGSLYGKEKYSAEEAEEPSIFD